jgi:hypothetical protein
MIAIRASNNEEFREELVRADAAYVQAYTTLAEFTDSCAEI